MAQRASSSGCSLLLVSPDPEDRQVLERCLNDPGWTIWNEFTPSCAARCLRDNPVHLVICESELPVGTWKDVLVEVQRLSTPPFLIVTSRIADEHLWAEALNLGAYDVLSKPFVAAEVARVLGMAWLHWKYQHEIAQSAPQARRASA
jgi:DNA-binding response OmpR family regulator